MDKLCIVNDADIAKLEAIFVENNQIILEKISILKDEYNNFSNVLQTPNSNKIVPELYDIICKQKDMIEEKDLFFRKSFKVIMKSYEKFWSDTKKSIEERIVS